jgi:hypothetical protein
MIKRSELIVEFSKRRDQRETAARFRTNGVAREIPPKVFAHHQHGSAFANGFRQEARVFRRNDRDVAKRRFRSRW